MSNMYKENKYTVYYNNINDDTTVVYNNCDIHILDSNEGVYLEHPHLPSVNIKITPQNIIIPIYVNNNEQQKELIKNIHLALKENRNDFSFMSFIFNEMFISSFSFRLESDSRNLYEIIRTVEVNGYKKKLIYPCYEVHSSNILKNSYSYVELPDELGLPIRKFPHFQRVLSLYPNCLHIPVLGDYIQVSLLNDELNKFLKQTTISKFNESYLTNHDDMVIRFTLELNRKE